MSKFKGALPRWQRRFRRYLTAQDLITGRKIVQRTTDEEGKEHISIEVVNKKTS
jgi:hypothetical protein